MSFGHLRSLLITQPLIVLLTIVYASASIVMTFFDPSGRVPGQLARAWARALLRVCGVRLTVLGLEKLDLRASYVFVANHRSYIDTPVVLASIPVEFRFFAKKGLFLIPFLGNHLKRAGHIPVPRGDARASLKTMALGARLIQERKISVLLFPEGGRTGGDMREFKEGAAYIAIKAGVPAVALGIQGTRNVLAKGSSYIRPGPVTLHIGDPVPTSGLTLHDRSRLNHQLRSKVAELAGGTVEMETPRAV